MPKRPQPKSRPAHTVGESNWSITSGRLTSAGRTELLKQLGSQMRDDYHQIIDEPVPDHLKRLARKMGKPRGKASGKKQG